MMVNIIRSSLLALLILSQAVSAKELSQYTATRVQKANELAQNDKPSQAIDLLNSIDSSRAYDRAFIARMLGILYWQSEQPSKAIDNIKYAVDSNELRDQQAWLTQKMLADLLLNEQRFEPALAYYYPLVDSNSNEDRISSASASDGVTNVQLSEIWMRIAQANYQINKFDRTLDALQRYSAFDSNPSVRVLSLKLGAQLQLNRVKNAIPTLEQLIVLEPDNLNWWRQLVSLQLQTNDSPSALATFGLAKLQGVELTEQDRRLLAQLYAQQGIPIRAAQILEPMTELKGNDVTFIVQQATYWQMAREWNKAIELWQHAAKLDKQYHWNVAQLLLQETDYLGALKELEKVTEAERQYDVTVAKVRALSKLDRLNDALAEAKKAQNIKATAETEGWIQYLTALRTVKNNTHSD